MTLYTSINKSYHIFAILTLSLSLSLKTKLEIVPGDESWTSFRCGPLGNVVITEIGLPLYYDDVNFVFNNLGEFANTVVNGVGIYFLQTQEEEMIRQLRKAIKQEVNSLIC